MRPFTLRRLLITAGIATAIVWLVPAGAGAFTAQSPQTLPSGLIGPMLVGDAQGTAYLVGLDGATSIVPFGGAIGAPEPLLAVEARAWDTVAGVSGAGELTLAYTRSSTRPRVHRRVRIVVRSAGGVVSAPVTVSQAGRTADLPALSVAADGSAVVAFERHDADGRWHVQYAVRGPGATRFGAPRLVSGAAGTIVRGTRLDVAARVGGGGVMTWETASATRGGPRSLMALVFDRDGAGEPATLEPVAAADSYGIGHGRTAVAYAPDGGGVIAWLRPRDSREVLSGDEIVAASLTATRIGTPRTLGSSKGPVVGWDATDAPGTGPTVVWASYPDFGADTGEVTSTVWARTLRANGSWEAPKALSHPGTHLSPGGGRRTALTAVASSTGGVLAIWGERSRYAATDDHLWWSSRAPGAAWSAPQALAQETGDLAPAAVAAPSGRVAIVWMRGVTPTFVLAFGTLP